MQVKIHALYPDTVSTLEGTEAEIHDKLISQFPWLSQKGKTVKEMVTALDRCQAYAAELVEDPGTKDWIDNDKLPEVKAVTQDGEEVAELLKESYKAGLVLPVKLSGKHSAGSFVARNEAASKSLLLKPDSGGQSPAKGAGEDTSSQSAREACFYQLAKAFGLGEFFPEAQLITVNGKEYAAFGMLPLEYTTIERREKTDPAYPTRLFLLHLHSGALHKWATMDFVFANVDRHGNNLMVNNENVIKLIDQGSAFAGKDFAPGKDKSTFIPYYLRVWAPKKFNGLLPEEKLRYLPRTSGQTNLELKNWIASISAGVIMQQCNKYGIDPVPSLDRLNKLNAAIKGQDTDLVINQFWVGL